MILSAEDNRKFFKGGVETRSLLEDNKHVSQVIIMLLKNNVGQWDIVTGIYYFI